MRKKGRPARIHNTTAALKNTAAGGRGEQPTTDDREAIGAVRADRVSQRAPPRTAPCATTYHKGDGTATPHEGDTSDASDARASDARAMRERSP